MATGSGLSGFDSSLFRSSIRSAMIMGLPNSTSATVTFRWTTKHTYPVQDGDHNPYDWTMTPATTTSHPDVNAVCAVQFKERGIQGDAAGSFDPSQAVITILDEDYTTIQGADQVLIGGNTYNIDVVGPPQGLFDVDVYTLFCVARDAT